MADSNVKRAKFVQKRRFCPHCSQYVASRTFFLHQEKYYNPCTGMWQTDQYEISSEESEMENDLLANNHLADEEVHGADLQGLFCPFLLTLVQTTLYIISVLLHLL